MAVLGYESLGLLRRFPVREGCEPEARLVHPGRKPIPTVNRGVSRKSKNR